MLINMKIITLLLASTMLIISAAWLHTQPANELFVWTIRNDAAETIAAVLAAMCAFSGMMLMVNVDEVE